MKFNKLKNLGNVICKFMKKNGPAVYTAAGVITGLAATATAVNAGLKTYEILDSHADELKDLSKVDKAVQTTKLVGKYYILPVGLTVASGACSIISYKSQSNKIMALTTTAAGLAAAANAEKDKYIELKDKILGIEDTKNKNLKEIKEDLASGGKVTEENVAPFRDAIQDTNMAYANLIEGNGPIVIKDQNTGMIVRVDQLDLQKALDHVREVLDNSEYYCSVAEFWNEIGIDCGQIYDYMFFTRSHRPPYDVRQLLKSSLVVSGIPVGIIDYSYEYCDDIPFK